MSKRAEHSLLAAGDGPAVRLVNEAGAGAIVLACEHASNRIPAALNGLGLGENVRESHAAWDPGAADLARRLSRFFDAPLVEAGFSRLIYDVNRPPTSPQAMRATSEIYEIPANQDLSADDREARIDAFYHPFHDALAALLDRRQRAGVKTVLVTVHSFTPVYHGQLRKVELGILHDADTRLADALLDGAARTSMMMERNQPYGPQDGVTHTLARHGLSRGLPNVMLEIRNDLLCDEAGQSKVADELCAMLGAALATLHAPHITEESQACRKV